MRASIVITGVLVLTVPWTAPLAAQTTTMRVTARIDNRGSTTLGRFQVPAGFVATDFKAEMRSEVPTTALNDRPSFAITSAGGGTVFFTRRPTSDGLTSDAPLALNTLQLQPGSYELRPGGGRGTSVAVEFTLVPSGNIVTVEGEWDVSCVAEITFEFRLSLTQTGARFTGDMVWTNGNGPRTRVDGRVLPDGSIEFIRSTGNWRQSYLGTIVQVSGNQAVSLRGRFGYQGDEKFEWTARRAGR